MTHIKAVDIFESLSYVNPLYIEEADIDTAKAPKPQLSKIARTLLAAALIAALFTAIACAAAWFGIKPRLIEPSPRASIGVNLEPGDKALVEDIRKSQTRAYVSLSGLENSPEYLAAAQWIEFSSAYELEKAAEMLAAGKEHFSWRDLERSFAAGDEEALAISRLYGVWDETMLEKLVEIADKYSLALHTGKTSHPQGGVFGFESVEYENGAVRQSCTATCYEISCPMTVYYEPFGTLPAESLSPYGLDEFEEWEYTNAFGDSLCIAIREIDPSTQTKSRYLQWDILIFCTADDAAVTLRCVFGYDSQYYDYDPYAAAQLLADGMDFNAVFRACNIEDIRAAAHYESGG